MTNSLLISDSFLPRAGGSRMYYFRLFRGWNPDRVTVLTKRVPGWQAFDATVSCEHFRIVRRFTPLESTHYRQLLKGAGPMAQATMLAMRNAVDVVHCGDLFPAGIVGLVLKRSFGIPYVAFCHGEEVTQSARFRHQPKIRNAVYRSADLVIANSEFSRRLLLEIGVPEEKIRKITPGVDCDAFAPAAKNETLVRRYALEDAIVLLTVSRLIPRKGHDIVLRAMANLKYAFPKLRYVIVGTGPEEMRLRTLAAELGIAHRVIFTGFVAHDDLADHYRLAHVVVMPNRSENGDVEGFGMTFLEASACGKAVIGGRSGGAVEAISDGISGILVDPNSAEDLTSILRDLLLSPEKARRLGLAGMARTRRYFDWSIRARELREVTAAIASSRKQSGDITRQGVNA